MTAMAACRGKSIALGRLSNALDDKAQPYCRTISREISLDRLDLLAQTKTNESFQYVKITPIPENILTFKTILKHSETRVISTLKS